MKKLLLALMLLSPFSFADWGDVYYCQMTNLVEITLQGEKESFSAQKFQFKLDPDKKSLVFGSSGYFKDQVYKLTPNYHWPTVDVWYASGKFSSLFFEKGKFLYTDNGSTGALMISADCDKF